jgi:hypothetical protein
MENIDHFWVGDEHILTDRIVTWVEKQLLK